MVDLNMAKLKRVEFNNQGICIKSQNEIVEFQNTECKTLCGHMVGRKCEKGCMSRYSKANSNSVFDQGYQVLKNVDTDGHIVDALMINDGKNLTTILFDRTKEVNNQLDHLEQFRLSKSEMAVIEKFLYGFKNIDIAKQLFISKSTLRTHLNNIYKKLPEKVKQDVLAAHFGKDNTKVNLPKMGDVINLDES